MFFIQNIFSGRRLAKPPANLNKYYDLFSILLGIFKDIHLFCNLWVYLERNVRRYLTTVTSDNICSVNRSTGSR